MHPFLLSLMRAEEGTERSHALDCNTAAVCLSKNLCCNTAAVHLATSSYKAARWAGRSGCSCMVACLTTAMTPVTQDYMRPRGRPVGSAKCHPCNWLPHLPGSNSSLNRIGSAQSGLVLQFAARAECLEARAGRQAQAILHPSPASLSHPTYILPTATTTSMYNQVACTHTRCIGSACCIHNTHQNNAASASPKLAHRQQCQQTR